MWRGCNVCDDPAVMLLLAACELWGTQLPWPSCDVETSNSSSLIAVSVSKPSHVSAIVHYIHRTMRQLRNVYLLSLFNWPIVSAKVRPNLPTVSKETYGNCQSSFYMLNTNSVKALSEFIEFNIPLTHNLDNVMSHCSSCRRRTKSTVDLISKHWRNTHHSVSVNFKLPYMIYSSFVSVWK